MNQAELQPYRALLQAQAALAPKRRLLFGEPAGPMMACAVADIPPSPRPPPPPPRRASLFGRRRPSAPAEPGSEPLLLETPLAVFPVSPQRLRLQAPAAAGHFAETPFHAEDLVDPAPGGPAPGVIAGWSAAKPLGAQLRLLRRLCAVLEAERVGLDARLASAGIGAR